ncbi:hypothetical protein BDW71DRAFT_215895 [Aspergillus fruticulosus]
MAATPDPAFPESIHGKTILSTGVSPASLGFATASALASQKPERLILTGRSAGKVQAAADELKSNHPGVKCDVLIMDLSSQGSLTLSEDGIEISFATNHIDHFLFTNPIIEKLIATPESPQHPASIVDLASFSHQFSPIRFSDINFSNKAHKLPEESPRLQKAQFSTAVAAKTANILFSISLNEKLSQYGIRSYAVHPGSVHTSIGRHSNQEEVEYAIAMARELGCSGGTETREQGANSSDWAAVNPNVPCVDFSETLVKAAYITDCRVADEGCADFAKDSVFAERLWKLNEELVRENFL